MVRNVAFMFALLVLTSVSYADWVPIGPDGGNIVALALDPQQPATLYALPYEYPDDPRVFKTTTGGSVWTSVGLLPDYSVSMLLVDPHDSDYLYGLTPNRPTRPALRRTRWSPAGFLRAATSTRPMRSRP